MQLADKFLSIGIWSEDHRRLAKWYENVLNFKVKTVIDLPNEQCIDFDFGNCFFFIGHHSKVHGKSKDPYRTMIGFNVASVTKTYQELNEKKVTIIAKPFEAPPGGFWCMTIADPEGNILQFVGQK
ncbi:VOC family protein [Candidatus Roizmanbacteria bacterium]|nr:VOC family protein [Candidatus Roizmanbacteria bacterium]